MNRIKSAVTYATIVLAFSLYTIVNFCNLSCYIQIASLPCKFTLYVLIDPLNAQLPLSCL